jgi:hypothetical protein
MTTSNDQILPQAGTETEATYTNNNLHEELPLQKFYDSELLEVPPQAQRILESYSKIPSDQVLPHVLQVRDRAWKTFPYPCIGHFRFLDFALAKNPAYPEILDRLKNHHAQFLDVGCCVGQEIRQLVADGVESSNCYATDLHGDFWDIGYDLFQDKEKLNSLFIPGDIFDHKSSLWQLQGKIDIVWTGSFLHLFDWKHQVIALTHMLKMLKPGPDGLVVGRLMGNEKNGEYTVNNKTVYRHNSQSFKKMFHEASDEKVGEHWQTSVKALPWTDDMKVKKVDGTVPEGTVMISFIARKLERMEDVTSHKFVF